MSSSRSPKAWALFRAELASATLAPAFVLLLIALCLLTGYSFAQAVTLFSQASRSAAGAPAMARGLSPFDGMLVPTFGAVYLSATLLYPFLAIRSISLEKESGSLKLLLQLPLPLPAALGTKLAALAAAWLAMLAIPSSAVGIWILKGGHINALELGNLLAGHTFYGFAIAGLSLLAASVADSSAAAALLVLAFVVGNWALDFSSRDPTSLSLTACLRSFEKGLFDGSKAAVLLLTGMIASSLCAVWLRIGRPRARRWRDTGLILAVGLLSAWLLRRPGMAWDATEDRRNSFSPADERALSELAQPLTVKVFLSPEDSRLVELERSILAKLRRVVPRVAVRLEPIEGAAMGSPSNDRYGLIVLEYGGKTGQTRSTSEEEVLPLLYGLAGKKAPPGKETDYPGYPLVADPGAAAWWFYLILPTLIGLGWWSLARRKT